ncbi:formyltetrahydrofolate deformylase [Altericroceibacterium spongiae]|uniref:Formyltetrahydrofolate deformylase n=1 Tax=Altericroceibacterium spongiae TaxID=2320269 RepID=A0A420EIZ0_9SPHN|nr:formyltetrahydrofolate deformylase [Altericroceibacterium spongiae]RKF20634.1 formyltetrahydrofolate deformylase [Altericroceibacterium spongiae]
MSNTSTLALSCKNQPGLVALVSGFLTENGADITDLQQYADPISGNFFLRAEFDWNGADHDKIRNSFKQIADQHSMIWSLREPDYAPKVVLMVSKFDHALGDLLYRMRIGEINMNVVAIVSNHPQNVLTTSLMGDIPYYHFPITKDTKPQQEAQVKQVVTDTGADLVVLARYMQILSDDMASFLNGRCINIHHSFLPGFKGAKPYHQAYKRGVKMIGATSHYVTEDLDEGPIIAQDVAVCSHRETPDQLVAKGRDVERRVLARAVKAHLEDRVFLNGQRTVVFEA